jgi:hypothetical protein
VEVAGLAVFLISLAALPVIVGVLFFNGPFFNGPVDRKPAGYRVRLVIGVVIGLAIVAAGVSIMFLTVSTSTYDLNTHANSLACGSVLHAMFSRDTVYEYGCGQAAFPRLWIAGAVAAVGMGVAFWWAGRGRSLAMAGLVLIVTGWIFDAALIFGVTESIGGD